MNDSQSHLIACLARWILDHYATRADRLAFLSRWEDRHGKASAERVKEAVKAEWEARRETRSQA